MNGGALVDPDSDLSIVLSRFPEVSWAAAYGSGVFPSAATQSDMVDLIIAVEDPYLWHQENLKRNPGDYAWLMGKLGAGRIAQLQEFAAGAYYNPYISVKGLLSGSSSSRLPPNLVIIFQF
jgi:hypothetical protein